MPIESLSATIAVLLSISLATERLVTIIKTIYPPLAVEKKNQAGETALAADRPRRLVLQALALAAAWVTAGFLADEAHRILFGTVHWKVFGLYWQAFGWVKAGEVLIPVPIVAVLASGGSAFWTQLLQYIGAVKDIAVTHKSSATLSFWAQAQQEGAVPGGSGRDPQTRRPPRAVVDEHALMQTLRRERPSSLADFSRRRQP
jgi:hypothetical protein